MKKSIETVWKKGFIDNNALVAPNVNRLYERKSIHMIDKFRKMFRINLIAIVVCSFIPLAWFFYVDIPLTAVSIFILLNWLVVIGRKEMIQLNRINNTESSYQYLTAFNDWIKSTIALYTRVYSYFYPLLFLSIVLGIWFSPHQDSLIEAAMKLGIISLDYPSNGAPLLAIIIVCGISGLLAYFGGALYRLDLNIIYGRELEKLEAITSDIQDLRNN